MKSMVSLCAGLVFLLGDAMGAELPAAPVSYPESQFVVVELSEGQLKEVESHRRFSLTKDQLAKLRSIAPGFPKRIGVVSPFVENIPNTRFSPWPDHITGIWFSRTGVAVPRHGLDGVEGCREFSRNLNPGDALLVDTAGDFSIGSKEVSREKLETALDVLARKEPSGRDFKIFILRPPLLEGQEEEVVAASLEAVAVLCRQRGIGCRIGG